MAAKIGRLDALMVKSRGIDVLTVMARSRGIDQSGTWNRMVTEIKSGNDSNMMNIGFLI